MMNYRRIVAGLKHLNLCVKNMPDIVDFESNMFLQKLIYIYQSLGFSAHYSLTLKLNDPYSSQLAREYHNESLMGLPSPYLLNKKEHAILNIIDEYIFSHNLLREHKTEFLEAIAFALALYLKNHNLNMEEDEIILKIREYNPLLRDHIISSSIAVNVMKRLTYKDKDQNPSPPCKGKLISGNKQKNRFQKAINLNHLNSN